MDSVENDALDSYSRIVTGVATRLTPSWPRCDSAGPGRAGVGSPLARPSC